MKKPYQRAETTRPFGILVLAVLFLTISLPHRLQAAPGDLDPTFGIGGKVTTVYVA